MQVPAGFLYNISTTGLKTDIFNNNRKDKYDSFV